MNEQAAARATLRRRILVLVPVVLCALNACESPRPSPSAGPIATPEQCQAIIARGGAC